MRAWVKLKTNSLPSMSKYLNRENVTALVIVVVGVLLASMAIPLIQSWTKKKTA